MKRNKEKRIEETMRMISIMSDDMPIYKFNMLKHIVIADMDRNKKRKQQKKAASSLHL